MTLIIFVWLAIVGFIGWLICGVVTLVGGGFLWPFDIDDEDVT
ncbi:Uncharacterised protein [Citrobacter braakii]|nr:hypothetical protein [Citrobacter braakii]STJ26706.1 Uncharacterised protein [Citrobacter braakii]